MGLMIGPAFVRDIRKEDKDNKDDDATLSRL